MSMDTPSISEEQPEQTSPEEQGLTQSSKDWVLTQAYTRLQQRQFDDALKLLMGLRALTPDDPEVYRMISYILLMADRPEECLAMADKYLQCIPPETSTKEMSWIQGRASVLLDKTHNEQAGLEQAQEQPGDAAQ